MKTFTHIGRQLPPIWKYCVKDPPGWMPMPQVIEALYPSSQQHLACCYIRQDGIQMTADLKDYGALQVIHLSLGPVKYFRPELNEQEWEEFLILSAYEVANTFFPGRKFARQPDDERKPNVKHFFAVLEAHEL
jgi:hypothetical protein